MEHPDVTLAILAGGKGTRLGGVPKGLLRVDGEAIVDRLLRLGSAFGGTLLIAHPPELYPGRPVRIVPDVLPDRGAPGGVHAALTHASTSRVVVVAADMPFVTLAAIRALLEAAGDARLACYARDGRLEPLPGLYRRELLGEWTRLLGRQPSLHGLFEALSGSVLSLETLREVDPDLGALVNVNQREDLVRWKIDWPIGWKDAQFAADD